MVLIGTRLLLWIDRKLYEWEMEGRDLNEDERRRGAVIPRARETGTREGKSMAAMRVSGISQLPKGSRAIRFSLA